MKVLFVNLFWDAAACSYLQHQAINKHTDWEARHFRGVQTFYSGVDMGAENYNREELLRAIREADVIEFCSAEHQRQKEAEAAISNQIPNFTFGFDWGRETKGKVRIYHDYNSFPGYWGDRAEDKSVWSRKKDIGYAAIFSSIPQSILFYEDCIYIPDVVDEQAPEYTPNNDRNFDRIMLGHYPTGGKNNKNTMELRAALTGRDIDTDITNKTVFHAELLARKRKINLAFDALWRGFHGMTTVENMALGIPTMCNIDSSFWPAFEECFGTKENPFVCVKDSNDIGKMLDLFKMNLSLLREKAKDCREFAEKHWSFKNIANRIVSKYEGLS